MYKIIMKGFSLCITVGLTFFIGSSAFCQDSEKNPTRVHLLVQAEKDLKSELERCLKRQLQSVRDVVITDNRPKWEISLVALRTGPKGHETVLSISVVISSPLFVESLKPAPGPPMATGLPFSEIPKRQPLLGLTEKQWESLALRIQDINDVQTHLLYTGNPNDVKALSQKIIADFDREYLEPSRIDPAIREKIDKILEKYGVEPSSKCRICVYTPP
jgi:hypothetical protein